MRKIIMLSMFTILAFLLNDSHAFAEVKFVADSDLLGLSLLMTKSESKNFIKSKYPHKPLIELPVTLASDIDSKRNKYNEKSIVGFIVDIKKSNQSDDGFEQLEVMSNPDKNSNDIFAVTRKLHYGINKSQLTIKVLMDSLKEKYGDPTDYQDFGGYIKTIWAVDNNKYNRNRCNVNNINGIFYEWPEQYSYENSTEHRFLTYINNTQPRSYSGCGMMLIVTINKVFIAHEYVQDITESLVDLTKGVSELSVYRNNFFKKVNELRNKNISTDMKNKPEL